MSYRPRCAIYPRDKGIKVQFPILPYPLAKNLGIVSLPLQFAPIRQAARKFLFFNGPSTKGGGGKGLATKKNTQNVISATVCYLPQG